MKMLKFGAMALMIALAITFFHDTGLGDGHSVATAMRWSATKVADAADGIEARVAARESQEAGKTRRVVAPLVDQLRDQLHTELAALRRRDEPQVTVGVSRAEMAKALAKMLVSASDNR